VLGQEYNRPAEAGVLKKPRGSDFNFNFLEVHSINPTLYRAAVTSSYRLAPRKLRARNIKFYILLTVQFRPNLASEQSTEKHNTYQCVVYIDYTS
jgi:hypothetical protein